MTTRLDIASEVLRQHGGGTIEHGRKAGELFAECPGKRFHTTANGKRDFRISLDGAPTGFCVHASCKSAVDAFNHDLRSRIGSLEWTAKRDHDAESGALDWDSVIGPAVPVVDHHYLESVDVPGPSRTPAEDLKAYLSALFKPDDVVAYNTDAIKQDGAWKPAGRGTYVRTAGDILAALESMPVDMALNATLTAAGAWCRLNPFDGEGCADANVTEYRHALVESDGMPIPQQLSVIRELHIPAVVVVHSGGKSLHAVVRIDAGKDVELYRKRVNDLYDVLKQNGFQVDHQNRNPSRLSRLPGVDRGGKPQYIVAENIGAPSWDAWVEWRNKEADDLPEFESLADLMANPPPLSPELIEGVLRRGHKMIMSGPSKSGKSWAMMQLCIAISDGLDWFGHKCHQGRVLYVDMELERASSVNRFRHICEAMNAGGKYVDLWSLRGKVDGMADMVAKLVRRLSGKDYIAVVLDPLYMLLMDEDENSNGDMARFLRNLDKVCEAGGISVVFSHHFSKGSQGSKKSIDRGSGAGALTRFPDAVLALSELGEEFDDGDAPAFLLEYSLREFPRAKPRGCWFEWPVHVMDTQGLLSRAKVEGATGRPKKAGGGTLLDAIQACRMDDEPRTIEDVARYMDLSTKTVRRLADKQTVYKVVNGVFVEA